MLYGDSFVFYRSDHLYFKVRCRFIIRTNIVKLFRLKKEIKFDSKLKGLCSNSKSQGPAYKEVKTQHYFKSIYQLLFCFA